MSEATARHEADTTGPPARNRRRRNGFRGPFRRRSVLIVVLVLVAGVLVAWGVTGGHPATPGQPEAGASAAAGRSAGVDPASPPAIPARLTARVVHRAVLLAWAAASGTHPVTGYVVYRDGTKVATVHGTTYRDTGAEAGRQHKYQVQSVDDTGTGSPLSPGVSVTVPSGPTTPDTTARTPPPARLSAIPTSFPTPGDTGARGALTTVTGDVVLAKRGQVYQNMRVRGTIAVTACDVTLRNVEVDSGEPYTGDSTPDLFAVWLQESATCGVTLDHVSTITDRAPDVYVTTSVRVARGGPVTILDSKLLGAQLGILGMSAGTIRGNYVELGATLRGDHNDAIQGDGARNLVIDHNTLLNPNDQTSALALYTEYGNNTNVTVSDNLLAGGGYTCYCGDGATRDDGGPARAVNVDVVDNVFWRKYFPPAGHYGAARAFNPAGGGQWANNVFMDADGTLTAQQVGQPALDGQ